MDRIKLTLLSVGIVLTLTACQKQPINKMAQQQNFICKSLIEGFLKTQSLNEYQLEHLQPSLQQTATNRAYRYQISSDNHIKINLPVRKDLQFNCQQNNAQHFEVQLIHPQQKQPMTLLSFDLPSQKTIETLTAFALKTQ